MPSERNEYFLKKEEYMELNNVTGAYTSAAKVTEKEEEKNTKKTLEDETKDKKVKEHEEQDKVEFSATDEFDAAGIEEKAKNYVVNILANPKLTEEAEALIRQYIQTFDVDKFIKMYGPFNSTAEVSAAMYAVTSHMIKYQNE